MSDLQSELQDALSPTYRLLKELGGGGMSRVFLAEEVELERRVVIKVLPPDMSAGVNKERFQREIKLAASLQHPHIVPLLTAGSAGTLLYYVMPYIEGESLRAKLAREGELPVGEAARILRDVVDALAAAHRRGVVHRDIKPDNVMLSDHHALVTDFGVAKAVSASSGDQGGHSLTSLGVALGTPAYMSPEQAAADPHTDHRADIYAVGALAYEMLAGQPPFTGPTPQAVLAAHVTQTPEPVTRWRAAVPPVMAELVMRCLEKRPADRWQNADELLPALSSIVTPTAGMTPTGTAPVAAISAEHTYRRSHPARVLGLYALGSALILALAWLLMMQLGLPDWVFAGAVGLLLAGLPIILITGRQERNRAQARMTGTWTGTPAGMKGLITWRKALWGGGAAFGTLALATAVYMAMRLLGIGPVGTLMASGVLQGQDRLLLTDFENRTADSTLGGTVTELFRIDLSQSRAVNLLEPAQVQDVLHRMERNDSVITPALAREIAAREGLKAYVAGDIRSLGSGYVLSTRLVAAGSGDALFSARETANSPEEVIHAVDRLSGQLRTKIGESLRQVRADPPLERITTTSTEALRLYTQATRAGQELGDYRRAVELLQQAVALDSNFAMGWRRLAAWANPGGKPQLTDSAATRAYQLRDRLSERERLHVIAYYHFTVDNDMQGTIDTYRTLLEKYPDDMPALNNIGIAYMRQGQWAEAEAVERRSLRNGGGAISYTNLADAQVRQGKFAAAESTLQFLTDSAPENPRRYDLRIGLAAAHTDFPEVERLALAAADSAPPGTNWQAGIANRLGSVYEAWGRLAESRRWNNRRDDLNAQLSGDTLDPEQRRLYRELDDLDRSISLGNAPPDALQHLETLWGRQEALKATKPADRPTLGFAYFFATLGRPDRARQIISEWRRTADTARVRQSQETLGLLNGWIEMAEGHPEAAIAAIHRFRDRFHCGTCQLWDLAAAWQKAGQPDSALATYEAFLRVPDLFRLNDDGDYRGPALRRMGEIYEEQGNRAKALEYYGRFTDLWNKADPELQPLVTEVKQRMSRLTAERS